MDEVGAFGQKGYGKSWMALQEAVKDLDKPGFSALILRRTSSDFEDLWQKARQHYAGFAPQINASRHIMTFPSGARVRFGHLQNPDDVFIYDGQEFQYICFDELMQFPLKVYLHLFSCLRGAVPGVLTRMRATGNPIGEGAQAVKSRFVDKLRPTTIDDEGTIHPGEVGWFTTDEGGRDVRAPAYIERELFELTKNPDWRMLKSADPRLAPYISREWIFGRRKFNHSLMKEDPTYEAKLMLLPPRERMAYLHGNFAEFDGERQLIQSAWIANALKGVPEIKGPPSIGADYAEYGTDKCVIFRGDGNRAEEMTDFDGMDHGPFAERLYHMLLRYGRRKAWIGIDSNGTGAGVWTRLKELGVNDRVSPMRAKDPEFDKMQKEKGIGFRFDNSRTQMWYKLMQDFQAGAIDLSALQDHPNFHLLEEDLKAHAYVIEGGVFKVIPKVELRKVQTSAKWGGGVGLGRSPDFADALAIWNWVREKKNFRGHQDFDLVDSYSPREPDEERIPSEWV